VIRSVLGGTNLEAFDLLLSTTSGEPICVSVTTSTVLAKSGAVILSFRDVTAERSLENELQQTKDFLERIIDSAVDAIVAADMDGRVILFNPGAERIFGHQAEDVINRLPVAELYPPGMARRVMHMLRSESHGGAGRLQQTRLEVKTKSGDMVPVNMTASILYENGREVATVGIVSDLRERLRMEERLLDIQEQLELQERQAMVAQLAGAAAHELNQPLTSILGYSQLIERQSDEDAGHMRAVQIIQREAARMADIVRSIGRITRYETKNYVGDTNIIDLHRSSDAPLADGSKPGVDVPTRPDEGADTAEIELGPVEPDGLGLSMENPTIDEIALADMTGPLDRSHRLGLDALIEPVEEEITAQHVFIGKGRLPLRTGAGAADRPPAAAAGPARAGVQAAAEADADGSVDVDMSGDGDDEEGEREPTGDRTDLFRREETGEIDSDDVPPADQAARRTGESS
jgi:PAS domain S-box-containing protein